MAERVGPLLFSRIVIFASGQGSGFKRLIEDHRSKKLSPTLAALVCNEPDAGVLAIAAQSQIPVVLVSHKGLSREDHEAQILSLLKSQHGIDLAGDERVWVVLAGYMRLFTADFVRRLTTTQGWPRMVNIHPSLLPSFPGVDAYGQALRHGVKVLGATVHFVTTGLDDGPIIAQECFSISGDETLEQVARQGHELEHALYGPTLNTLACQPWRLHSAASGGRPRLVFTESTAKGVS